MFLALSFHIYLFSRSYSSILAGYNGSLGDFYNQGYYIAGNGMDHQYPVSHLSWFSIPYGQNSNTCYPLFLITCMINLFLVLVH